MCPVYYLYLLPRVSRLSWQDGKTCVICVMFRFGCSVTGLHTVADPGFEVRGGGTFLGIRIAPPPPLRGFPEATIKVYTWIFFELHPPPPHEFFFLEATIKVYTWIFCSEATIKVYA